MSTPSPPNGSASSRAGVSQPVSSVPPLLEALRRAASARLQGLIAEALAAAETDLVRRKQSAPGSDASDDDLHNVMVLRGGLRECERRWQARFDEGFDGWPMATLASDVRDAYALLSDDELQAQLVGQPVIESLERRHVDVLDVINSRLWSFSATLGGRERPANPLSPRRLVDAFLHTFDATQATPSLRSMLLRHHERAAGEALGPLYASINTQLADAGHALGTGDDVAMLVASTRNGLPAPIDPARNSIWSNHNALAPTESTWREGGNRPAPPPVPLEAVRGTALRDRVRGARTPVKTTDPSGAPRRELRNEEFLAVLSLVQGDETAAATGLQGLDGHLRRALAKGAAGLGIAQDTTRPAAAQDDAIDLIALLFDGLNASHDLSPAAQAALSRLAPTYLRLALDDAHLFDDREHPAMQLLSLLVQCWDANPCDTDADAELHALADAVAANLAAEYHGTAAVFPRLLAALQASLEPLRKRADIAERRAWQSLQGRERLQAARRDADGHLARLSGRPLLGSVAQFLDDQWRQSLIHAWLREGPDSDGFAATVALGDAIVAIDAEAARAVGSSVARGLLALQDPLRACFVACGVDENGAGQLLATLVGELAQPDARRTVHAFTPPLDAPAAAMTATADSDLAVGQVLVLATPERPPLWLRLAWRSPLSGTCLLVTRQGAKHSAPDAASIAAMLADGRLRARSVDGPVEGALSALPPH